VIERILNHIRAIIDTTVPSPSLNTRRHSAFRAFSKPQLERSSFDGCPATIEV